MDRNDSAWAGFRQAIRRLWHAPRAQPQGAPAAARSFLMAALARHMEKPLLVIAADEDRAGLLVQEIRQWLGPADAGAARIFYLAKPDARAYERIPWTGRTRQSRLTALAALLAPDSRGSIVIGSVAAMAQKTLPPRCLRDSVHTYRVGDAHQVSRVALQWAEAGYAAQPLVESAGTFARRGSILDIWPANLLHPVRFDFLGDELESLRLFDPQTQRSTERLETVAIGPASEALARQGPDMLARIGLGDGSLPAAEAANQDPSARGPWQDPGLPLFLQQEIAQETQCLAQGESFNEIEWYLPYMYGEPGCPLDYLGAEGALLLDDGADCEQALKALERESAELRAELLNSGDLPAGFAASQFSYDEMLDKINDRAPILLGYGDLEGRQETAAPGIGRCLRALDLAQDAQAARPAAVRAAARAGTAVLIFSQMGAKVTDMLEATGAVVDAPAAAPFQEPPAPGRLQLRAGALHGGFSVIDPAGADAAAAPWLQVITDAELFDVQKTYRRRQTPTHKGVTPEQFFAEVAAGDHVVHVDFGIGCYAGLATRTLKGLAAEYIQVDYRDGDRVLVPVHQANRISRYVGSEDPALNKLGSSRWATAREKVKREVQDIAQELLRIYADREVALGRPAGPDDAMQQTLELSFPFEETADQMQAIQDVKADLETPRHMDRLVVGDVGFGKTEVAIRAAFKMVLDGRQAVVLAPTTVLAHQHYATFTQRMQAMPVRIEVLSRLRSLAERRRVKAALAQGGVDIVIGTHALLAKDVQFKQLGLLIIDEEQRFGVKQKERIKSLKPSVNVLTMSATPIPRTMNMGLSGIRDISYITTPPEARMPVHTVSAPFDATLVRKALERELRRAGQAFVVTDKVRGIAALADEIARLAPGASIDIAHGQMKGEELEDAMLRFATARTDILVCTTIIENGLDIPNANTIVINNADRFGMAQLYQLRGRVGRSHKRGHCYLLYGARHHLSALARSRLQHIVEASDELGAGFRIAMSDLQLRGAGEILGARQSGGMGAIGLDLYTRLLANEVAAAQSRPDRPPRRGEAARRAAPPPSDPFAPGVTLHLPLEARIPAWYVEDAESRYRFYHRIAGLRDDAAADEFRRELIDRFGSVSRQLDAVPEEIENLLYQIKVKRAAEKAVVESISHRQPYLVIKPRRDVERERHLLMAHLRRDVGAVRPVSSGRETPFNVRRDGIYLTVTPTGDWRELLLDVLASYDAYRAQVEAPRAPFKAVA